MNTKNDLYTGVSRAAWAYFFLYFDVNLNTVSILPSFVCYLLLLSSIRLLSGERRDLLLLRPLCIALALWYGADWVLSWVGLDVNGHIQLLDLLAGVIEIYLHFQLFTDFAALAAKYQGEGENMDRRLLRWRTLQTLLCTVLTVWSVLPHKDFAYAATVALILSAAGLVAGLCLMAALFRLRRLFADEN